DSLSLRRRGLLRDSSRRARRLLAIFKKMKKDASAGAPNTTTLQKPPQVSTSATVAATLSALDLDDPIFAPGASARTQTASTLGAKAGGVSGLSRLLSAPVSFPGRDLSTIVDLSTESAHAMSRPSSHARMNDATSSPPKVAAPPIPTTAKPSRKASTAGLDPLVFRGLIKLSSAADPSRPSIGARLIARRLSERSQQRLQETLTTSVSGSYSVYDGEASPRKEVTSPRAADAADRPAGQLTADNDGDTIAAAMQRMQKMRLLSDRQATTFRLGGVFGDGISATSSPKLPRRKPSEPTLFRFPTSASNPVIAPDSVVNYCDLSVGGEARTVVPPTPRATPSAVEAAKTNYARIDALSTIAAKEASDQRKLDRRKQSSSTQTLTRKSSFFSKRFTPMKRQTSFLRRRTSITSLTDL
uniref:Uncharacterized protein n=1 Tax=Plectus sambesii TaxID=2011161 RepID=A0A914XI76_9BILA